MSNKPEVLIDFPNKVFIWLSNYSFCCAGAMGRCLLINSGHVSRLKRFSIMTVFGRVFAFYNHVPVLAGFNKA